MLKFLSIALSASVALAALTVSSFADDRSSVRVYSDKKGSRDHSRDGRRYHSRDERRYDRRTTKLRGSEGAPSFVIVGGGGSATASGNTVTIGAGLDNGDLVLNPASQVIDVDDDAVSLGEERAALRGDSFSGFRIIAGSDGNDRVAPKMNLPEIAAHETADDDIIVYHD